MRTADSIAQQAEQKGSDQPQNQRKRNQADYVAKWQWKKGQSGNPGGRPKKDFAAEFARMVLEAQGDEKMLSQYATGFAKQLFKGNAYTFKELAERGYGKLPQHVNVTNTESIAGLISEGRKRVAARKSQRIQ